MREAGLGQGSSSEGGKKGLESGCILKVEHTVRADRLGVGSKKKREVKGFFELGNWKDEVAIYRNGKN